METPADVKPWSAEAFVVRYRPPTVHKSRPTRATTVAARGSHPEPPTRRDHRPSTPPIKPKTATPNSPFANRAVAVSAVTAPAACESNRNPAMPTNAPQTTHTRPSKRVRLDVRMGSPPSWVGRVLSGANPSGQTPGAYRPNGLVFREPLEAKFAEVP